MRKKNLYRQKFRKLTQHNKSKQQIAKSFKTQIQHNIHYNKTPPKDTSQTKPQTIPKTKNTHPCVYEYVYSYKLKCNDHPEFYIGQTGRYFKTRYTEHIQALTQPLINSKFAEHKSIQHSSYLFQH